MSETSKKVQIQFDGRSLEMVGTLKTASHRGTLADVVRDALMFYDWCRRQVADGFVICAVKADRTKEIVLPFSAADTKEP